MKNSQEKENSKYDEYEDLTLFADESFDTGDVDLFEFSSEDDSPLTRLKSIILSLDWEINDEILQELVEETRYLAEMWQGDKIAEIYLQGLEKIGRYIQNRGAYAHPNAIKLLLTFYYNFEKISVSEDLSEDDVTALLKEDVRKFRILQYQINQEEKPALEEATVVLSLPDEEPAPAETFDAELEHMRNLKASILGLDWEVTDDGLLQFNDEVSHFHSLLGDDRLALVLVQGLRALGDYIQETKAAAHPESFTLLHSFSEALEQVVSVKKNERDAEEMKALLTDRIGRLNTLKAMIAEKTAEQPSEEYIDEVVDEITSAPSPKVAAPTAEIHPEEKEIASEELEEEGVELGQDIESELDELFPMSSSPGMESADSRYPDEVLPPEAIKPLDDEVADDFIGAQIGAKEGITPALAETEELFGFDENTEPLDIPAQSDLNDQLDLLFGEIEEEDQESTDKKTGEPEPALSDQGEYEPALSDFEAPADTEDYSSFEPEEEETAIDIESKLDFFFADEVTEKEEKPVLEATPDRGETKDEFTPALADSDEEKGFDLDESVNELEESPLGDIEEKLDFFFDGTGDETTLTDINALSREPDTESFDVFAETEEVSAEPPKRTSQDKEEEAFEEALTFEQEEEARDLDKELDFFFDAVEDDEEDLVLELDESLPKLDAQQLPDEGDADLATFMEEAEATTPLPEEEDIASDSDQAETEVDASEMLAAAVDESLNEEPREEDEQMALPDKAEERDVHIAALGALLPGVVRAPTEGGITEIAKLVNGLKQLELPGEEKVVIQYLQGILNQLVHSRYIDATVTERLVNTLYEKLAAGSASTLDLPSLTEQYMEWQQGVVAKVVASGPSTLPSAADTAANDTAKEMDFQQIRRIIREEFDQLKEKLQ